MPDPTDDGSRRPDGVDDATVDAVGLLGEYVETIVRARGRLYDFHQLMGGADAQLGEAVEALRDAGHDELAELVSTRLLGRNVLEGNWTFEVVEEFDTTYWDVVTEVDDLVRGRLVDGRPHVLESEMKADRRADGPTDDV